MTVCIILLTFLFISLYKSTRVFRCACVCVRARGLGWRVAEVNLAQQWRALDKEQSDPCLITFRLHFTGTHRVIGVYLCACRECRIECRMSLASSRTNTHTEWVSTSLTFIQIYLCHTIYTGGVFHTSFDILGCQRVRDPCLWGHTRDLGEIQRKRERRWGLRRKTVSRWKARSKFVCLWDWEWSMWRRWDMEVFQEREKEQRREQRMGHPCRAHTHRDTTLIEH